MAATVQIEQATGASPDYTVKSTTAKTRYYTADSSASGATTNPIPIPTENAGISGSFWVSHCINVTVAPTAYIKDLRWYLTMTSSNMNDDWLLGGSGDLMVGVSSASVSDAKTLSQGCPNASYDQATGTTGSFGDYISSNHTYYSACASALSGGATSTKDYDSLANALMVQSGQVVAAATGRSDFLVTQVLVGSGATQGDKDDKTATFVYSEV